MTKLFLFLPPVILLNGCSTALDTRPFSMSDNKVEGAPYALPALEMEVTTTRRLKACNVDAGALNPALKPEFEVEVKVTESYPASEWFNMNFAALGSSTKTTSFSYDLYDNMMIKSVNVEAEDKSLEIIGQVAKAGLSIATLAGGLPIPAAAGGGTGVKCPDEVDSRHALEDGKKADVAKLDQAQKNLSEINERAGSDSAKPEDAADKKKLVAAIDKLTKSLASADKKIAELDKKLALVEVEHWRPDAGSMYHGRLIRAFTFDISQPPVSSQDAARQVWIEGLFGEKTDTIRSRAAAKQDGPYGQFLADLKRQLSLTAVVNAQTAGAATLSSVRDRLGLEEPKLREVKKQGSSIAGVVTRIPVQASYKFCAGDQSDCDVTGVKPILEGKTLVPQMGPFLVLPFRNGFGQNNVLKAEFANTGLPTKIGYDTKNAVALSAAQTLNGALDSGLKLDAAIRADRKAGRDQAKADAEAALKEPGDALARQLAELDSQKKILDLQIALDPANVALTTQKANLENQLTVLKAAKEVEEASKTP